MGFGHVVQKHRPIYKVQKFSQKTKKYHLKHWKNECFPFGTCSCWWKKSYTTWGIKPCQQWDKLPYQLVQDFVHQQYVRIWRFCTHLFFCILTTKSLARWLRHRMQRLAPCAISAAPAVKMRLPLKLPSVCPRNQQGPTKRGGEWLSKILRVGKNYETVHWEINFTPNLKRRPNHPMAMFPPLSCICKAQSFRQQNGCTYLSKFNGDIVHLRLYCVYSS